MHLMKYPMTPEGHLIVRRLPDGGVQIDCIDTRSYSNLGHTRGPSSNAARTKIIHTVELTSAEAYKLFLELQTATSLRAQGDVTLVTAEAVDGVAPSE